MERANEEAILSKRTSEFIFVNRKFLNLVTNQDIDSNNKIFLIYSLLYESNFNI